MRPTAAHPARRQTYFNAGILKNIVISPGPGHPRTDSGISRPVIRWGLGKVRPPVAGAAPAGLPAGAGALQPCSSDADKKCFP